MTVREEVKPGQLAELLKQVQAGNEVVLTQDQKPVAKIVAASAVKRAEKKTWKLHSLKGHKVLTPNFTHAEIADEMFGQK
jgi:prevent-host-death family protein